jgi:hypothetical protein
MPALIIVSTGVDRGAVSDTYCHIASICLRSNFSDKRCAGSLGELGDGVDIKILLKHVLAFVKIFVEDNTGLFDTLSLCEGSVICCSE